MLKQLIHTLVGEQEEKATITLFIVILQRRVAYYYNTVDRLC